MCSLHRERPALLIPVERAESENRHPLRVQMRMGKCNNPLRPFAKHDESRMCSRVAKAVLHVPRLAKAYAADYHGKHLWMIYCSDAAISTASYYSKPSNRSVIAKEFNLRVYMESFQDKVVASCMPRACPLNTF